MDQTAAPALSKHLTALSLRDKLLLGIGVLLCYALWYLLLRSASIPAEPGFSASLLADQPLNAIALIAVGVPLMAVLASAIVGRVRPEAGLFCALAGLIYLPTHGGDVRHVLLESQSGSVYLLLALELAILGAIVLATPLLLQRLYRRRMTIAEAIDPDSTADRITGVAAQALCTLVILMLLGQSPVKGQAIWAAGVSGMLATLAVQHAYRIHGSMWYVLGTLIAGVAAYVYTSFQPAGMQIGDVRGMLAGAARSLPLHYATAGVVGVIFGYWTSLIWHAPRTVDSGEPAAESAASA